MRRKKVLNEPNGKSYNILKERETKIESILAYGRDNHKHPCLYHFTSHIVSPSKFQLSRFLQNVTRQLNKEYNKYFRIADNGKPSRRRNAPQHIGYYSVETKNGYFVDNEGKKLPDDYLHIHLHLVCDCSRGYHPASVSGFVLKALNNIDGLQHAQYHRRCKDFGLGDLYHNLNINPEFDDAVQRGSYLAKLDQKGESIPFKKTWGCSRLKTCIT